MQLLKPKQAIAVAVAFAAAGIGMFADGSVSAKSFEPSDIGTQSYVIGEHLFTRETNPDAGYEGYINTRMIMLAAKTIQGNTLEDMDIYYKKADGSWVDGLTNEAIANMPDSFNIEFKNLDPYISETSYTVETFGEGVPFVVSDYSVVGYSFSLQNLSDFQNNDETLKVDGFEQLVLADDAEDWIYSLGDPDEDCQIMIGEERYCHVAKNIGDMTDVVAIFPVGKTYHVVTRAYKSVGARTIYGEPNALTVTVPNYYRVDFSQYPGDLTTGFVPEGGTYEFDVSARYGYTYDGLVVARECTAEEKASYGLQPSDYALCPTNTPYNAESPITADIKVAAKWVPLVYSIKVMPTDAIGSMDGIAKVYADNAEITDKYVAYTTDDDIFMFNSQNPSIALNELNDITTLKLVITYDGTATGGTAEETFVTTASVTVVPYSN